MPVETTRIFELTDEQQAIVDQILRFPKPVQSLGGYAGTGKTVVAVELKRRLPNWAVCAYTGKAASVLRRRGIQASTIHSLIYDPVEKHYRDEGTNEDKVSLSFHLKEKDDLWCNGFLVDESSMVGADIDRDLRSFGLPIIYIGDHGQLPPVMSGVVDLMKNPDYRLETLHRNAGEIARFAEFLREGNHCTNWEPEDQVVLKSKWSDQHGGGHGGEGSGGGQGEDGDDDMYKADQIICAFNATRVKLNRDIRHKLGFPPETPVVGDRIMCLRNSREKGLYNGMQGTISAINKRTLTFTANEVDREVEYSLRTFNCEKHQDFFQLGRVPWVPFDYCYTATCHKMQGDEADFVAVIEQRCAAWDHRQWAYTAASRAKQKLLWIY